MERTKQNIKYQSCGGPWGLKFPSTGHEPVSSNLVLDFQLREMSHLQSNSLQGLEDWALTWPIILPIQEKRKFNIITYGVKKMKSRKVKKLKRNYINKSKLEISRFLIIILYIYEIYDTWNRRMLLNE
jgi:hypothetical protein